MKRKIIFPIIGAAIGGITLFPPAIPLFLTFTLSYGVSDYLKISEILFWFLPIVGLILGGLIGHLVEKNGISLKPYQSKSKSFFFWSVFVGWLLGLEIGFLFSPVTMIGLGSTSTAIDLWLFPILTATVGGWFGVIVGFAVLTIHMIIKKIFPRERNV
jgi:hypothetical protein